MNYNTINPRQPCYSMVGRNFMPGTKFGSPGPAAYLPNKPKSGTGGFPFGVRTDTEPYVTADDDMPCVNQ